MDKEAFYACPDGYLDRETVPRTRKSGKGEDEI
jgi:hypothetical protein